MKIASLLALVVTFCAAAAQARIDIRDYGATPNSSAGCAADDRAAIQAALDAVPASGGEVFIPAGVYEIGVPPDTTDGGALKVKANTRLVGEGKSSILRRCSSLNGRSLLTNNAFMLASPPTGFPLPADWSGGDRNIHLENFAIDGAAADLDIHPNDQLIWFRFVSDSSVENTWIYNAGNDGIVFEYCRRSSIINNMVFNNNKGGIYAPGSDEVTIVGNRVHDNGFAGIVLGATWSSTVSANVSVHNGFGNGSAGGITLDRGSNYNTVTGNTCDGILFDFGQAGSSASPSPSTYVRPGNPMYSSSTFLGSCFNVVSNNTIWATRPNTTDNIHGIRLSRANDNLIVGNDIHYANRSGVQISGGARNVIRGNRISSSGTSQFPSIHVATDPAFTPASLPSLGSADNVIQDNFISDERSPQLSTGITVSAASVRTSVLGNTVHVPNALTLETGTELIRQDNNILSASSKNRITSSLAFTLSPGQTWSTTLFFPGASMGDPILVAPNGGTGLDNGFFQLTGYISSVVDGNGNLIITASNRGSSSVSVSGITAVILR